jgi:hypothetical protein
VTAVNLGGPLLFNEADREIVDRIVAPALPKLKRGMYVNEGYRFFCFGETDSGKTSLMRAVLYYTIAQGYANFALVHDSKGVYPEYPRSVQAVDVESFRQRWFVDGDIPVVSFRGDVRRDVYVSPEDVAGFSKWIAQQGQTVNDVWTTNSHILLIEELAAAMSAGRKHVSAPSVVWALEQGRKVGVSCLGTTQSPRKVAMDILGQGSSFAFFRLTGHDANFLGNVLELDPALIAAVRGPNNVGLPNHQFCIYVKGEPWDGEIHCLDKRTVQMFE